MSITNLDDLKRMRNSSAIQQRLEWLESRIFWIGEFKRKDLIDNFGISIQQATSDIRLYQSIAPDNLKYDGNVKRYLKTESAIPIFNQSPEKWLSVSHQESKALRTIQCVKVNVIRSNIQADILMNISRAYYKCQPISILYQSSQEEPPKWFTICPHSIVETSIRLHIRGWHIEKRQYCDIVPNRIIEIRDTSHTEWVGPEADIEWNTFIDIELIPSRQKMEFQRQGIERDYKMADGVLKISTRACLIYYQLSAMYLVDAVREHQGEPPEHNIGLAVKNWQELIKYVKD